MSDEELRELLSVIVRLADFLYPGTSHSEPGDAEVLRMAQEVVDRYGSRVGVKIRV